MRDWFVNTVARRIPQDVRVAVLLEELAKTPRGNLNAMATPVEEVLRHMKDHEGELMMEMVQRYKSVPEFVEAIPVIPATVEIAANWCGGVVISESDAMDASKKFVGINVPTLMGVLRASEGDYIVKNADGHFNVFQQRMFREKFKPIRP